MPGRVDHGNKVCALERGWGCAIGVCSKRINEHVQNMVSCSQVIPNNGTFSAYSSSGSWQQMSTVSFALKRLTIINELFMDR